MDTIIRPVLDRCGLKLPANIKSLLNTRGLDVYDILQLIVNTVNKIVKANDGNIDKEEKFLGELMTKLNEWANRQEANIEAVKNAIMNYIATGEFSPDGFITSSECFEYSFWVDIANSLLTGGKIYAPGEEGNDYNDNGNLETGSRWVLRLDMWSGGYKWIDLERLVNNIQIIMDENRGAVFQDNNNDFTEIGEIPFATEEEGGLMRAADKKRLDEIYIGKVSGGQDALYIDGEVFVLQKYVKPESEYEYLTPRILGFSYEDISANGGTAHPYVGVDLQVKVKSGSAGMYRTIHVTASYEYNEETGKMETTYTNSDYLQEGGELKLEFEYSTLPSNVSFDKSGVVSKSSASQSSERVEVAVVTVKANINGMDCETASTCSVYQEAAVFAAAKVQLPSSGAESFFDIEKSAGVTVNAASIASSESWFVITKKEVQTNYVRISYKVGENNGTEKRTATVMAFTNLSDEAIVIANIEQANEAQSITSKATDSIGAGASDFREIEIVKTEGVTLIEEDVLTFDDWINITAVEIYDKRVVVTYTADANPNTTSRVGFIVVDTNLGAASCVITIKQAAKAQIGVSKNELSFEGVAGGSATSKTVTVAGQNLVGPITVEVSGSSSFRASTASISQSAASKSGGATLTITWTPPETAGTVTGKVTLKATNADNVEIALSATASGQVQPATGYHGATSEIPTTVADVEAGTAVSLTGSNTVSETGAKKLWVAVPTGRCSVTCKDENGLSVDLVDSTVGDYTVYAWSMKFINNNTANFTIVLL